MKTLKVPRNRYHVLQALTRKEISTLRKYPSILAKTKHLLQAYKSIIRRIENIPEHASRRKRETVYKRVISICKDAIDAVEGK